ncbi:MAG: site-specific tyrosine recombinase/integron integrase [Peptoanaerobacter stomatis]|uniref:site-specific tyrosine recombinase/integron integrase n=1 Tax=Peptoanaerobacter stomatis TaxID=796937 RepID=UPI003F9ED173
MRAKDELLQELFDIYGANEDIEKLVNKYVITKQESKRTSLKNKINQFIIAKQIDNLSVRTLENYKLQLIQFEKYIKKPVNQISTDDIRTYISYLSSDRKIKLSSIETYIAYIKTFFAWCSSEEIIKKDPTVRIKSSKFTRINTRNSLKIEEQEKIRDICKDIREKAIVEILISTGCRLSEIANINIDDVDIYNRSIKVIGKGNKVRTVYFSTRAKLYLQQYISTRKGDENALFVSKKAPYIRLKGRAIQKIIRQIGLRAKLNFNLHPHLFRHTFATNCLNIGMDIVTIQRLLGHSNLQTTQIYAKMSQETIKNEYMKFIK